MKKVFIITLVVLFFCIACKEAPKQSEVDETDKLAKAEKQFSKLDADKDIRISETEWKFYYSTVFKTKDKNKDGFLTKEDIQAQKFDFLKYDMDKNGEITLAEFIKPMQKRFNRLDINKDGSLTRDDIKLIQKPNNFDFSKYDRDSNNRITLEEFTNPVQNNFYNLDKIKDNLLTADDLEASYNHQMAIIMESDANKDGKVDQSEWMNPKNKYFTKKDTNGDGYISKSEFLMK